MKLLIFFFIFFSFSLNCPSLSQSLRLDAPSPSLSSSSLPQPSFLYVDNALTMEVMVAHEQNLQLFAIKECIETDATLCLLHHVVLPRQQPGGFVFEFHVVVPIEWLWVPNWHREGFDTEAMVAEHLNRRTMLWTLKGFVGTPKWMEEVKGEE